MVYKSYWLLFFLQPFIDDYDSGADSLPPNDEYYPDAVHLAGGCSIIQPYHQAGARYFGAFGPNGEMSLSAFMEVEASLYLSFREG